MAKGQRNARPHATLQPLLVASPHVCGTIYDRRVVFLVEHTPRRSVGLLLDNNFQASLRQLRKNLTQPARLRANETGLPVALPADVIVWGPGQLATEVEHGVWLHATAELEGLMHGQGDLWTNLVRQVGRSVLRDALHIQHFLDDPSVN